MTVSLPAPSLAPAALKCTCADWWGHPAVPLLVGEAMRPGGAPLTASLIDRLELPPAARVLDIGSGTGATLALLAARGFKGFGVDYSAALATQAAAHAPTAVGDGEVLPFAEGVFAGATLECVLSALPDKPAALAELHRVLVPCGWLILTDMTMNGRLPDPLDTLLAWVACAAGALPPTGYQEALADAGFAVSVREDHPQALADFVAKARRRLALLQGAIRVGIIPDPETTLGPELTELRHATDQSGDLGAFGRHVLDQVADAVRAGQLGYSAFVARRA